MGMRLPFGYKFVVVQQCAGNGGQRRHIDRIERVIEWFLADLNQLFGLIAVAGVELP